MPVIINGDTGITQPGEFDSDSTFGFKNRIINGGMVIDQRNNGASATVTDGGFSVDRFQSYRSSGTFLFQRSTTAPAGFINSLQFTVSSAGTRNAGDYHLFQQLIEGLNLADMAFGTANASSFTISFWVRSSVTGLYSGSCNSSDNLRTFPFTYTINSANTFEYKTVTIPGDTSGAWTTTNAIGMYVRFDLGSGTNYQATAGAGWQVLTNRSGASGTVGWAQTSGATFFITGVQLEKGSTATSFDFRSYGTELALCQRYYQTNTTAIGGAGSSTAAAVSCVLMSEMRATPTATLLNGTNALDELYTAQRTVSSLGGLWGNFEGLRSVGILLNSSGLTTLRMVTLFSGRVGLSAEL